MNKNNAEERYQLKISGINLVGYRGQKIVFSGNSPTDVNPSIKISDIENTSNENLTQTLSPYSLTILRFYKTKHKSK